MANRPGRILPNERDVAWLEKRIALEKQRGAGDAPRRPGMGPAAHVNDLPAPSRPGGRPRSPESVRGRLASLAVGDSLELESRANLRLSAQRAGVRVTSEHLVTGLYRITRIPDDSPRGRWPAKNQPDPTET